MRNDGGYSKSSESVSGVFLGIFQESSGRSVGIQQHRSKSVRNTAGILPEYFSHLFCCCTLSVPALDQVTGNRSQNWFKKEHEKGPPKRHQQRFQRVPQNSQKSDQGRLFEGPGGDLENDLHPGSQKIRFCYYLLHLGQVGRLKKRPSLGIILGQGLGKHTKKAGSKKHTKKHSKL